jgi:S1-C subfamily serine protease
VISLVLLLAACAVAAEAPQDVGPYLQSISVNIKAKTGYNPGAQGSGTVVLKEDTAWILTAHHVVDGLREVRTVIGADGEERKQVRYRDVVVVQDKPNPDGSRIVGDERLDAKVTSVDSTRDIALLRVRAVGEFEHSAKFCGRTVLPAGTRIFHCGAPGGQDIGGTASLTGGIVSRTGVRIPEFGGSDEGIFDQVDCSGLPGSSGGMVCLQENGAWIGMITLGLRSGDSFHWLVPVRNVREWAAEVGVEWLLDPDAPPPSEDDIKKIPLEYNAPGFSGSEGEAGPNGWRAAPLKPTPAVAPLPGPIRMVEPSE